MQNLIIRPVESSDEAANDAIYAACMAKQGDVKGAFSGPVQLALTCPESQSELMLEGWPILVATLDGRPVGIGCAVPFVDFLSPIL